MTWQHPTLRRRFLAKRFCAFIVDGWSHVRIRYRTPKQLRLLQFCGLP